MVAAPPRHVGADDACFQGQFGFEDLQAMPYVAEGRMPSLVTPWDNAHKLCPDCTTTDAEAEGTEFCMGGSVFQEVCGHGNWRWIRKPCDKWTCEICRRSKLFGQLVPEIVKALQEARRQRVTLKLTTLTWQGSALGAQPTKEGAERRRLDEQHLIQWLKRQGYLGPGETFYLRVAETHRSGKVHLHLYIILPFVPHKKLKAFWRKNTGGSRVIDVQPVYLKCPRCWVKGQTRQEKHTRRIVPWPGSGKCATCGYTLNDFDALARGIAIEAGKYLAKDGAEGVRKKLTRSGSIKQFCSRCDTHIKVKDNGVCPSCEARDRTPVERGTGWARFKLEVKQDQAEQWGTSWCLGCGEDHKYVFVGIQSKLKLEYPGVEDIAAFNAGRGWAWMPSGGSRCACWGGSLEWSVSACATSDNCLGDFLPLFSARDGPAREVG